MKYQDLKEGALFSLENKGILCHEDVYRKEGKNATRYSSSDPSTIIVPEPTTTVYLVKFIKN